MYRSAAASMKSVHRGQMCPPAAFMHKRDLPVTTANLKGSSQPKIGLLRAPQTSSVGINYFLFLANEQAIKMGYWHGNGIGAESGPPQLVHALKPAHTGLDEPQPANSRKPLDITEGASLREFDLKAGARAPATVKPWQMQSRTLKFRAPTPALSHAVLDFRWRRTSERDRS
jgi:hypothetical protein